MNNGQPADIVKHFKVFREQQRAQMERVMAFTPRLEEIFLRVSSAIGNDPIRGEPIARVNRLMADYQRRWGITLAPIAGPSISLVVDSTGALKLHDENGEQVIDDVIQSSRDLVLIARTEKPDIHRQVVLQDYLYQYIAQQLERAMRDGIAIQ